MTLIVVPLRPSSLLWSPKGVLPQTRSCTKDMNFHNQRAGP